MFVYGSCRFLGVFELALKANNDGQGFFFGDKVSAISLHPYELLLTDHVCRHSSIPSSQRYGVPVSLPIPILTAFKQRIQERPNIKAFLESDRSMPFYGDSML